MGFILFRFFLLFHHWNVKSYAVACFSYQDMYGELLYLLQRLKTRRAPFTRYIEANAYIDEVNAS